MPRSSSPRSLLWDTPAPARQPLSRDDLVRAALVLLDDAGFDGLTMRSLAERLGVQAASLYNHIRDKRDVLTLVADTIVAEVPSPDPSLGWAQALASIASEYRRVLLAHRDAARVLTVTPPLGPNRLRLMDAVLGVLRRAGFSDETVADAAWVVNTFVTGFVLDEQTQVVPPGSIAAAAQSEVADWLRSLSADQFPNIVATAGPLLDQDIDRRFQFGLDTLISGLETRFSGSTAR